MVFTASRSGAARHVLVGCSLHRRCTREGSSVDDPVRPHGHDGGRTIRSDLPVATRLSGAQACRGHDPRESGAGVDGTRPVLSCSEDLALVTHEKRRAGRLSRDLSQPARSSFPSEQPRPLAYEVGEHQDAVLVDQISFGESMDDAGATDDDDIVRCLLLRDGFE